MATARQDYLLRQMELLRQFMARLAHDHRPAEVEQALQLSLTLQEKLMPLPAADFLQLDAAAQLAALSRHEQPEDAAEKCLTYAELLVHTAGLYDLRGRDDLALGARQLALHIATLAALEHGDAAARENVALLRLLVPDENLHPPVRELLRRLDETAG